MGEKIFLGVVTSDADTPTKLVVSDLDLAAPIEQLQAAIERAERERFKAQQRESAALRTMFLPADETLADVEPPPPVKRDWLRP